MTRLDTMRRSKKYAFLIFCCISLLMINLFDMEFSKSFNTPINLKIDHFHTKNTNLNPKNSLQVGNNSFSDEGLNQKVELFQFRNETIIRNNTDQGGVIVQNDKDVEYNKF